MQDENKVTYFAETDFRNQKTKFGIKRKDRTRHMYIIGKTGMGKSTLLENLAVQDIQNGEGVAFIDPHGSSAEKLLEYVPEHRIKDVIYFAPFDLDNPISFNVLESMGDDKNHLIAGGLMNAFKKIWQDAFSGRMEYILNNTLLALLEYPGATLLGVNRMYSDKDYRKKVVDCITDPSVKSFWVDEYAKYSEKFAMEATASIQNKIGQFTSNPLIRNMVGQPKSSFDFRKAIDEKKIMIFNLSKGKMGPDNMRLVGGMIVTKIYLAAMSRADKSAAELKQMPPLYLYVDEFQNFANESFAEILSESRKYNLALTVANQYIEQMTEEVRAAILGNVGSMVTFRIGAPDAGIMEKEFTPYFTQEDLVSLGFGQIYLKLMIDGIGSKPFSAQTIPPIPEPEIDFVSDIISESRRQFTRNRKEVEEEIALWHNPIRAQQSQPPSSGAVDKKPPQKDFEKRATLSENTTKPSVRIPESVPKEIPTQESLRATSQENKNSSKSEKGSPVPLKDFLKALHAGEIIAGETPQGGEDSKEKKKEAPLQKTVSLHSLAKEKSPEVSQNKVSLKDAIEKALQKKKEGEKEEEKTQEPQKTSGAATQEDLHSAFQKNLQAFKEKNKTQSSSAKEESTKTPPHSEKPLSEDLQKRIKEIPEETLKRILDVSGY
jgi:hypothetical protein